MANVCSDSASSNSFNADITPSNTINEVLPISPLQTAGLSVGSAPRQQNENPGRRLSCNARQSHPDPSRSSDVTSSAPSTRSLFTLNPEAAEYVPGMTASTKRKASFSESASSSNGYLYAEKATTQASGSSLQKTPVLIPHEALFGKSDSPASDFEDFGSKSSLENGEQMELTPVEDDHSDPDDSNDATPMFATGIPSSSDPGILRSEILKILSPQQRTAPKLTVILIDNGTRFPQGNITIATRYLPLCSASNSGKPDDSFGIPRRHRILIEKAYGKQKESCITWPVGTVPKEIFDMVTGNLTREDVKNMRLVNKEFEGKVSSSLFYSSVVPFNTELYDMISSDAKNSSRQAILDTKDQNVSPQVEDLDSGGIHWQNAKDDAQGKMYRGHGLKVFQGFGPHIKRFGMSFEVTEDQLAQPPVKKELYQVDSYHGSYDWPPRFYARFENLAGLERTADETSRMKAAFSHLSMVQELGLAIDSGLGWLRGLDTSVRARLSERPAPVFGKSFGGENFRSQAAKDFWTAMRESHLSQQRKAYRKTSKEVSVAYHELDVEASDLAGLKGSIYANSKLWPTLENPPILERVAGAKPTKRLGVLYTTSVQPEADQHVVARAPVVPNDLKKEQKEWLLETEWAQRAFLDSYMLSVTDNVQVFEKVSTLTIAKISSGLLPMLARETFWSALPSLAKVTLHVKADWRSVAKDDAGMACVCPELPSDAVITFHDLLAERVVGRQTIKTLDIGWVDCGEHAEGILARNSHLLPAPISSPQKMLTNRGTRLVFTYLEHLTLTNCWLSPPALRNLVRNHAGQNLTKLTLDSVSITADPSENAAAQHNNPIAAGLGAPVPAPNLLANTQSIWNPPHHHQNSYLTGPNLPQAQGNAQTQQPMIGGHQGFANLPMIFPAQVTQAAGQIPAQNAGLAAAAGVHHHVYVQDLLGGYRLGSWPETLDIISPGPRFIDHLEPPKPWEEQLPAREPTALNCIEFKSCGYAVLPNIVALDQSVFERPAAQRVREGRSSWFDQRGAALFPSKMTTADCYLGKILPHMPARELEALQFVWGLREGWDDKEKAEEAEWDGQYPGGTGRFSGVVYRDTPPTDG
ncbi:hypothetical protein KC331_g9001 [Hortaea werneckii]|uniref:F-box domain-containing protein n=1 Tax=Hortaea werneckii TaxID=91943 RepID=A0A3M7BZG1_HORWE|nr:hypothetical protein KC331_g9001 [Hortaea werneckii]KAI7709128.1 hypothetical protein KC353_g10594 [Hortaea werneckii]RMY45232.1 hypothetical protein D0865_10040 [Hortaea werneckii]